MISPSANICRLADTVVFTTREHVIALEPRGKGLLGVTLRYPYEVRKEDEYFADIEDEKIPKDMMELEPIDITDGEKPSFPI